MKEDRKIIQGTIQTDGNSKDVTEYVEKVLINEVMHEWKKQYYMEIEDAIKKINPDKVGEMIVRELLSSLNKKDEHN